MADEISDAREGYDWLREEFVNVLRSRRRPLDAPGFLEASWQESSQRLPDGRTLLYQDVELVTEEGEQGRMPVTIVSLLIPENNEQQHQQKRAAVILLHSTNKSKEALLEKQKEIACLGFVAITCDNRYHGARASSPSAYSDALVRAWRTGQEMPFLFDPVWDVLRLLDYLTAAHTDIIDCSGIGITGVSLGGMVAWLAAMVDPRIAAAAPMIGVQCFKWAVDNNCFHARVASIPHAFNAAAADMGKSEVDAQVVTAVWNRITPGLLHQFGPRNSLPAICPRPLLILNGESDPRCPVEGLREAVRRTEEAYSRARVPHRFEFYADGGVGHEVTDAMWDKAITWMQTHLLAG
ncbi:hypothetical protein CLOM_g23184 [Closterium sp. NIES-68]|nr:hypothetical protein CLOM_g23184 [Closterium sp. NIES-68]GJP78210.1 hypothetical protein CLOP_g8542 [Closterium sp. NIES-67]